MFELLGEPPFEEEPPFVEVPSFDLVDGGPDDLVGTPDADVEAAGWDALTEFEESLERVRLEELDADATLTEAAGTVVAERRAQARQLDLATRWADQHGVLTHPDRRTPGCERLIGLGGDGTPEVAEFASAELGAVLGVTDNAAKTLLADALDLRHRFPRLWARVQNLEVAVWMARKTVEQARPLSKEAALRVDARIADRVGSVPWGRLRKIIETAILHADPAKALDDAERAAAEAGATVGPDSSHGYQTMVIKATTGDIQELHKALGLLARAQRTLGDPRPLQQRRATAAGILANPQQALDLLAEAERVRQARRDAAAARRRGDHPEAQRIEATLPAPAPADSPTDGQAHDSQAGDGQTGDRSGDSPAGDRAGDGQADDGRPFVVKQAVMYVHLTKEVLDAILAGGLLATAGVVRVEDVGPVIAAQVKEWLQHANVTVKPVIDLAGVPPIDRYEATPRISEAIGLRNPADAWPYGTNLTRRQDNEHVTPYRPPDDGGPPGQTDPATMVKMTRFHHRIKTHSNWTVTQPRPGARLFRSPHGRYYLTDEHGTTALGTLS